jgi:teichoic acid glycerol-phosphate primase
MNANIPPSAGFIYGPMPHYIDHLAPLCDLLQIPLIVTEEEIKASLHRFYPNVTVILQNYIEVAEFLVQNFSILFVCTPRVLFDEICFFAQKLNNKFLSTIWCPHGNSDKGHLFPYMQALDKEHFSLVYGQKMIDFLKQKNAFSHIRAYVETANFRKAYYLENQKFYDQMTESFLHQKLPLAEKTVLYAPTWQDAENSSSFYTATFPIIENLPGNWNLLIKPHPNLLLEGEAKGKKLLESCQDKENVLIITDFPPIHPLLAQTDIYIGDFSSVGYDFLSYNRPMFFLNEQKRDAAKDSGLFLYRCGIEIHPEQYKGLYKVIQDELVHDEVLFSDIRQEIDSYTFGKGLPLADLKKKILSLLESLSLYE